MIRFLRTASRRTLLSAVAAVLALAAGCTAIAVAAGSGGPVPPRRPLAVAIHRALSAPAVTGLTARITFTDNLISSSELQGSDPLLGGGQGRLWLDPARHRLRIEVQGEDGDAQLVVNGRSFWIYDPAGSRVFTGVLPAGAGARRGEGDRVPSREGDRVPTVAQIARALSRLAAHLRISAAIPSDVAGRPAYTVAVSPHAGGGLLASVRLAWDALRGVPLRLSVYARNSASPVLELSVTHISYGAVPAADFSAAAPQGAKVTALGGPGAAAGGRRGRSAQLRGLAAVRAAAPFALDAPATLAGFSRGEVRLLGAGARATALIDYGRGLDGVLVVERSAASRTLSLSSGGGNGEDHAGLSIPTVTINGISAPELQTALGTVLQFRRAGVSFTVLGSVPAKVAESAARGL